MRLEEVLQHLYDGEINITLVTLWDGGFNFALASYMAWPEIGTPLDDLQSLVDPKPERAAILSPWHSCERASDLAESIHRAALDRYPESTYARLYARPN